MIDAAIVALIIKRGKCKTVLHVTDRTRQAKDRGARAVVEGCGHQTSPRSETRSLKEDAPADFTVTVQHDIIIGSRSELNGTRRDRNRSMACFKLIGFGTAASMLMVMDDAASVVQEGDRLLQDADAMLSSLDSKVKDQ
eukprot:6396547-Amphidinium_carterae.1